MNLFVSTISNPHHSGDFQNGKRHGQGVYVYANGDAYQGGWDSDFKSGVGTYSYVNGSKKVGFWSEGKLQGKGQIVHSDHQISGVFASNDTMHMPVEVIFTKSEFSKIVDHPASVGMVAVPVME